MGHDIHFLERLERVDPHHQAIALSLYRDPALVKRIVSVVCTRANLPEGDADARVALALEDGGQGPHIIVTRAGRFVTCLGRGMAVGPLPVLSRAMLDADLVWVQHVRESADRGDDVVSAFLSERIDADLWPSRADLEAVEPFIEFYIFEIFEGLSTMITALNRRQELLLKKDRRWRQGITFGDKSALLIQQWGTMHRYVSHVSVALAAGTRNTSPLFRSNLEVILTSIADVMFSLLHPAAALRALWIIIQREDMSPAMIRQQLDDQQLRTYSLYMPATLGRMLNATLPAARAIDRTLASMEATLVGEESSVAVMRHHIQLTRLCWEHRDLPLHERARLLADHPKTQIPRWQRRFYDPELLEREPERAVQDLLALDQHKLRTHGDVVILWLYAAELAKRRAPLLYPIAPAQLTRRERFERDMLLFRENVDHHHDFNIIATSDGKQGRNDPCACGSGKKHKKCCGAAEA